MADYIVTSKTQGLYITVQSEQIEILNEGIQDVVDDVVEKVQQENSRYRLPTSREREERATWLKTVVDGSILYYGYTDAIKCVVTNTKEGIVVKVETYPLVFRDRTSNMVVTLDDRYNTIGKINNLLTQEEYYANGNKTIQENAILFGFSLAVVLIAIELVIMKLVTLKNQRRDS